MHVLSALGLITIAGCVNGAFALPTKYAKKWNLENIWLFYAILAFVILPWVVTLFLSPQILTVYSQAPGHILIVILVGGLIFGAGQVCLALALDIIGLGLGFVIILGLGIMLGFLLPLIVQHSDRIMTPFGITTLLGCLLAIAGLIFSNYAGVIHNNSRRNAIVVSKETATHKSKYYFLGIALAAFAGIASAGQNFCFAYTSQLQQFAFHLGVSKLNASLIMWPGFLLCAFIPYAVYMFYLIFQNNSLKLYLKKGTSYYCLLAFIMAVFWYGSLVFYSEASQLIGVLGPLVGWPLFMILVILSANFWGWRHKEWMGCSKKARNILWMGLSCMIFAIIVLAYSSYFYA
jgi:L-rhamnose-H+ transport protein